MTKENVLPWPTLLVAQMCPPCSATIERQMARPSPVPPLLRESVESTCWKRPKIDSSWSAGMPRPVSRTVKRISPPRRTELICTVAPGGENFTALPTRFVSVCRTRSASASNGAGAVSTASVTSAAWAAGSITSVARAMSCSASQVVSRRRRASESRRSRSRMSLIRRTRRSVFSTAIWVIRCARSGSGPRTPLSSRPSEPRIEVSGVRSSWLTTDVNSFLVRSIMRRSVTSRKTTTAPRMHPSCTIGVLVYSTGKDVPSLRQ